MQLGAVADMNFINARLCNSLAQTQNIERISDAVLWGFGVGSLVFFFLRTRI